MAHKTLVIKQIPGWRWALVLDDHVVGEYPSLKWAQDEFKRIVRHGATADDLPVAAPRVVAGKPFNILRNRI